MPEFLALDFAMTRSKLDYGSAKHLAPLASKKPSQPIRVAKISIKVAALEQ